MVPGNLFSAKKVNSRTGPRGSNKEGFGCQKKRPGEVEKGAASAREKVVKR